MSEHPWTSRCGGWLLIAALSLPAGCGRYALHGGYTPQPASLAFNDPETEASPDARALVTVAGVLRRLSEQDRRRGLELKLRLENLGRKPLRWAPEETVLLDASLETVTGPLDPPEPLKVEPDGKDQHVLRFVLPSDSTPEGLNLRLTVSLGDSSVTRSISFERRRRRHSDTSWPYNHRFHSSFHFGYHFR